MGSQSPAPIGVSALSLTPETTSIMVNRERDEYYT